MKGMHIGETQLRRVARILGPSCAAAKALERAEWVRSNGGVAEFLLVGDAVVVKETFPAKGADHD